MDQHQKKLKLTNVFAAHYARRDETFGNARLARNLFEKAINAHASRMMTAGTVDEASLVTLYPEDIPNARYQGNPDAKGLRLKCPRN